MAPTRPFEQCTWLDATEAPAPFESSWAFICKAKATFESCGQALFHCPELYERIPMGKGRHYHIAEGPIFPFIILQDSTRHWTLHAAATSDGEMAEIFKKSLGMPVEFEMLSVNEWTQHLPLRGALRGGPRFHRRRRRAFSHPHGGLGMNTGVGDAIDLSWKLACDSRPDGVARNCSPPMKKSAARLACET